MTDSNLAQRAQGGPARPTSTHFFAIRNQSIRRKLAVGFGMLVLLTLTVIGLSLWAGNEAVATIQTTDRLRLPSAAAAWRAQANLLRMLSDVRGYLVLGDQDFIKSYEVAEDAFRRDLDALQALSGSLDSEDRRRIEELQQSFDRWTEYPTRLFALRDDQMDREPAYELLNTSGTELGGDVLINTRNLIELLTNSAPSELNNDLLRDMSEFQGSFAAMFSGLRGYITTRNSLFRHYEYQVNLEINNVVWQRLQRRANQLDPQAATLLDAIATSRQAFLDQIPSQTFAIMQSPGWRRDLEIFSTEVIPLTDLMQQRLEELTAGQESALTRDLKSGNDSLNISRNQTVMGGIFAVLLGLGLAVAIGRNITGPIDRLTRVAEQIREGDLVVQAKVESTDEIGTLATTFNAMTGQLRHTLVQVRHEKMRADNLLEVVIPIGVALAAEKNYNRLLEKIVLEARSFCRADSGILYMRTNQELRYVIIRTETMQVALGGTTGKSIPFAPVPLYDQTGSTPNERNVAAYAALHGRSVNIANAYTAGEFEIDGPGDFDNETGYPSLLTIPLKNSAGEVLGVLQLRDAEDSETGRVIPFDANLQQMMESFSSLAIAALEAYIREQSLRQEIKQLRIEIDEVKRQQQVSAIVETDFFRNLQAKARAIRGRHGRGASEEPASEDEAPPAEQPEGETTIP